MKIKKYILGSVFGMVLLYGCSTLEDTFSDFTSEPEKIYIGAADSIYYQSGIDQVRISVVYNSDPKIAKGHLVSQDGRIEHFFDIVRTTNGVDTAHLDLELDEGIYRFNIQLLDNNNNSSLKREILVNVLGNNFLKTLSAREIENISFVKSSNPEETGALLSFGKLYAGLRHALLYYTDSEGNEQSILIENTVQDYLLTDFEPSSQITLASYFQPVNPFDEFIAPEKHLDTLPACNSLQYVTSETPSLEFDSLNTGGLAVQKIRIKAPDCILGALNLTTELPFGLSTTEGGPFQTSISVNPLTDEEIFIAFQPTAREDSEHTARITAGAVNVLDSAIVSLTGIERGVNIGGLERHPVEMRSLASHIFTDDLNVLNYNTNIGNLWDGGFRWPSAIHSLPSLPVPAGFFTIDLGGDFKIREIDWMLRLDCCHERANHKYQYWGLPSKVDPSSAITTVEFNGKPENKSKWEQEMFSRGWINLGNFEKSQEEISNAVNTGTVMTDAINVVNYVRYVRVVVLETFEGETATINFSELDFQVELE